MRKRWEFDYWCIVQCVVCLFYFLLCLSVCLSVCVSVCLSVWKCINLSLFPFRFHWWHYCNNPPSHFLTVIILGESWVNCGERSLPVTFLSLCYNSQVQSLESIVEDLTRKIADAEDEKRMKQQARMECGACWCLFVCWFLIVCVP